MDKKKSEERSLNDLLESHQKMIVAINSKIKNFEQMLNKNNYRIPTEVRGNIRGDDSLCYIMIWKRGENYGYKIFIRKMVTDRPLMDCDDDEKVLLYPMLKDFFQKIKDDILSNENRMSNCLEWR